MCRRNKHFRLSIFFLFFSFIIFPILGQYHESADNYIGNWEDAATWDIGDGSLSNNDVIHIYGFVKRNSDLTLNNGIELYIYDTLMVYGNMDVNQTGSITVASGGVIIVYGNVTTYNNVDVDLSSYFVVYGDLDQRNNSEITAPAGDTLLYVTGGSSCSNQASCLPSDQVGDEDDLLNNPDLVDLILATSSNIIPSNPVICSGNPTTLSIRSDGSAYQWYRNGTAIAGANSYTYDATQAGEYDVSFTVGGTTYARVDDPEPVTVSAGTSPVIYWIGSNSPVQVGNAVNLQLNAGSPWPTSVTGYSWSGPDGFFSTNQNPSFTASAMTNSGYYVGTVYNDDGCSITDSVEVTVYESASACCSGFTYYSRDNYTGDWEDAASWGSAFTPKPPPTNPMSTQTICINGYITVNGDLTINGGNQKICDTLVITGNLNVASYSMSIASTGVLIVLGDFTGNSGSIQNEGRVVLVGETTNPYSNSVSGSGDIYVFDDDPDIYGFTPTGDESTLDSNDHDLYNFIDVLVGGGCNVTVSESITDVDCNGNLTGEIDITPSGGTGPYTFVWSNAATSEDISGVGAGDYDVTITDNNSCTATGSYSIAEPAAIIVSLGSDTLMCEGTNITLDAGVGYSVYSWSTGGSAQTENITNSGDISAEEIISVNVTVTDGSGCSGTSPDLTITFYPIPETGPAHHINDNFGN